MAKCSVELFSANKNLEYLDELRVLQICIYQILHMPLETGQQVPGEE